MFFNFLKFLLSLVLLLEKVTGQDCDLCYMPMQESKKPFTPLCRHAGSAHTGEAKFLLLLGTGIGRGGE